MKRFGVGTGQKWMLEVNDSTYGSVAKRELMLSQQQYTTMGLLSCSER